MNIAQIKREAETSKEKLDRLYSSPIDPEKPFERLETLMERAIVRMKQQPKK